MFILGRRGNLTLFVHLRNLTKKKFVHKQNFSKMYAKSDIDKLLGDVRIIDFRSDTLSTPTAEMRKAIYEAEVGDDVYGEDPTVIKLETKAAEMMGKESSLFVTSGTMGNLIAIMAHCDRRGCDIIAGDMSHIILWEQAGAAQIAGVQVNTVKNKPDGTFCLKEMMTRYRDGKNIHYPRTSLICVESTHNFCGGKAVPMSWINELVALARDLKVPLHMDGARLFNAAIALGIPVTEIVKDFDSISLCLSKGLGAPVGSMLVGSAEFIAKARRLRKVLGGGMRQAGILAAAGLYALNNMVDRLAEDHERARRIAKAIVEVNNPYVYLNLEDVHSNMLFINCDTSKITCDELCARLMTVSEKEREALGSEQACIIKLFPKDDKELRLVIYHNNTEDDIQFAIRKIQLVLQELKETL
uniref:Aromatic amino acid beta-eliminating lyase/threonine aldolase domain-containing protein n=1 Tax=Clastoptera arizonana TaxID=38151 RepID=A0A1B6EFI5_9HEMI